MAPAPTTPQRVSPKLGIPASWSSKIPSMGKTPTLCDLVQQLAEAQADKLAGLTAEEAALQAEEAAEQATLALAKTLPETLEEEPEEEAGDRRAKEKEEEDRLANEVELYKQGLQGDSRGPTYDSYLH
jgi:hypothetical protein